MKYQYELPPVIRFGCGVRFQLPEILPPGGVLLVCGSHALPEAEKLRQILTVSHQVDIFTGFPAEVPLDQVDAARRAAEKAGATSIVSLGGGSAIDLGKAVSALRFEEFPCADYFYGRRSAVAAKCFFAALPTTAGTGSEATANAVLHDPETLIKQSLRTAGMMPDAALVDPELLFDAPPAVIAAPGMDALTQAIESFTSRKADDFTRFYASSAVRILLNDLAGAFSGDREKIISVCRASLMTGMAFGTSGLGAVHGLAHPLGSCGKIPHGMACAVLLTPVMRFNAARVPQIYQALADAAGVAGVQELVAEISSLRTCLGIPDDFKSHGFSAENKNFIIRNSRSGSMKCNPVELSDSDLAVILDEIL